MAQSNYVARLAAFVIVASLAAACDFQIPSSLRAAVAPAPRSVPSRAQASAPVAAEEALPGPAQPASAVPGLDLLSDAAIAMRIKAGIGADPAMAGADVSVNSDGGVVNLTGLVLSHEQSAVASAHAQREDGVMRIDNHLSVQRQ